jgi:hypothetical protein
MIEAWLDLVRRDRHLPANAFHVAYEISLHFNRDHFNETEELVAWPAVDTIKEKTKLGKNTVHRMLDALTGAQHLVKETGVGRSNRNQYCALFDVLEEGPQEEKVPQVGPFTNGHVMPEKVPLWEEKVPLSKIKGPTFENKRSHLAGSQPADLPADPRPAEGPAEIPDLRSGVVTPDDFQLEAAGPTFPGLPEQQDPPGPPLSAPDDDERRRYEEGDDDGDDDDDDDEGDRGGPYGTDRGTYGGGDRPPPAIAAPPAPLPAPAAPSAPAPVDQPAPASTAADEPVPEDYTSPDGIVHFTGAEIAELKRAAPTSRRVISSIMTLAEGLPRFIAEVHPSERKEKIRTTILEWHNNELRRRGLIGGTANDKQDAGANGAPA